MPSATKTLENPQTICFERAGRAEAIMSDWRPFVVERNLATKTYAFVFGFEADCGTEPIDSADQERSSIRNKFTAYSELLHQDVPRRHFGATTFLIPIVTTNEARMRSMMALLSRLEPGAFAKRFLFKHIPSLIAIEKPAPSNGLLLEPWQRVGCEPFSVAQ
jgi:hypothetical protein